MSFTPGTSKKTSCYHCGEDCDEPVAASEKIFCCEGCKMVYEIINQNGLCDYYDLESKPGINQRTATRRGKFAFLDNPEIVSKLIRFENGTETHVIFYLPQMHCSSCIWLLEHLTKLNKGILKASVNFLRKEVTVIYTSDKISLRTIAEILTDIGYEPHISLQDMDNPNLKKYDRSRIYKLGIAGFCFGNIMLLSFPDYFSSGVIEEKGLKSAFSYISLALSLPVFFYCASGFFISAYKGLKQKFLNIDTPIALAILITFLRSVYEITTLSGSGYLDSMSGIVFFMLIGRFFQNKTYDSLAFNRDYRSYFPIGVTRLRMNSTEEQIPLSAIKKGDRLKIHSEEIIPADGILFLGKANIDYSFVTGESIRTKKMIGELVYAGGKQTGPAIEIEVIKEVSQSYLAQLWNNGIFKKDQGEEKKVSFVHQVSRYFTYVLFSIALIASVYWYINDPSKTWNALTAVLIVACPCALLLSATFTNGNMLAKLQKAGLFVKNANALESVADCDTIAFDKTGTLSVQGKTKIQFECGALSLYEKQLVRTLVAQSNHPLSKAILARLPVQEYLPLRNFREEKGKGLCAVINNEHVKVGSEEYVTEFCSKNTADGSRVFVAVNSEILGYYAVTATYRDGLPELINELKTRYKLVVLSGDNNSEEKQLRELFGTDADLLFRQSPQNKLDFIRLLQNYGRKIIMVGDGLNDAGALRQSNLGIVVSDDINNFSPACDAVLEGKQFSRLKTMIDYCRTQKKIIYGSFIVSVLYNIIGLYFAVQGSLSPVIAAILMPVSSVSIVVYTAVVSSLLAKDLQK
jgi:Cu+-exporting ATPase